jgi:O-antigen/teichoic acid export membrane protein
VDHPVNITNPVQVTARQIAINTLCSSIAQVGRLLVGFLLLPFLIRSLGSEVYGLWAVVGSIVGYVGLLDLGVGAGFVKFLSEYIERGEKAWVRQVMTFGLVFYLALGLLLVPVVYLGTPHILAMLKLAPGYRSTATNLATLILGYFFLSSALGVNRAMIGAFQRVDLTSLLDLAGRGIYAVSAVALIDRGYGVYALPYAMFIGLGVVTAAQVWLVYRLFGNPWSSLLHWNATVIRRLFAFGGWMQISAMSALVAIETDRIIVGAFVGMASVTWFEVGNRLALLTRLPLFLLGALLPAAAAIDARGEGGRLDAMYVRGTRYLAVMSLAVCGFLVGAGRQIERVWMRQEYPHVTVVMTMLALSYTVNNLTGVGTVVVRAIGRPRYETYYAMLSAILKVLFTLVLGLRWGMVGVVVGTAIGSILGSLYFFRVYHSLRHLHVWPSIGYWLWRLGCAVIAASALLWITCNSLIASEVFASRLRGGATLALLGPGYLGTLIVLLWAVRFWDRDDKSLLQRIKSSKAVTQLSEIVRLQEV